MDLYGKPVQDIYNTFLHLSGSINDTGSIVYDGRGAPSIVTLSTNACKLSGNVIVNNIDLKFDNYFTNSTTLTSRTVLALNRATSAVEIRPISTLLPARQRMAFLPTINLVSFDDDITAYKAIYFDAVTKFLFEVVEPNDGDEVVIIQKFYYQDVLRDISYDLYKYSSLANWSLITSI